jgi:hypothetical protein
MENEKLKNIAINAAKSRLEALRAEMIETEQFIQSMSEKTDFWDLEIDLNAAPTQHGLTGKTGVYVKLHKPTQTVCYVGQGVAMTRRAVHKGVFLNDGNARVFTNKDGSTSSTVDSPAGRKMYAFDSNIDNWATRVSVMPKPIAAIVESKLSEHYNSEFNDAKMLGKS